MPSYNFRDVGKTINNILKEKCLSDIRLPENKIYRGGNFIFDDEECCMCEKIDDCDLCCIHSPKTVINLKNSQDNQQDEKLVDLVENYFQISMENKVEKYDTSQSDVKSWLNQIIKLFEDDNFKFPVFIHCAKGKDRTGIVIATILMILEVPKEVIIMEYLLNKDTDRCYIEKSVEGILSWNVFEQKKIKEYEAKLDVYSIQYSNLINDKLKKYFNKVDLIKVRRNIYLS